MTGRGQLRPVPDERELRILEWLGENEGVDSRPSVDVILKRLPGIRQSRSWPWSKLVDGLRPPPYGHLRRPLALVVGVVALGAALLGVSLLAAGSLSRLPSPTATPSASRPSVPAALFPLANTPWTIAYADGGTSGGGLWLIGTDGSEKRKIGADIAGGLIEPDWSPIGDRLLALNQVGDREQLWEIDPSGAEPSLVVVPCAAPCGSREDASFSFDGDRIAFFEASGTVTDGIPTTCGLRIYTRSTQVFETVTSSPCGLIEERQPRFSPDGKQIAFWRSRSAGGRRTTEIADAALFVRDLRTGKEQQITDWPLLASSLDWSPDSKWIVFTNHWWDVHAGDAEVWRVRPDGSGVQRLTHIASSLDGAYRPRYSPDGDWILFVVVHGDAGQLWAIAPDGGEPVRVLPGIEDLYHFDLGTLGKGTP